VYIAVLLAQILKALRIISPIVEDENGQFQTVVSTNCLKSWLGIVVAGYEEKNAGETPETPDVNDKIKFEGYRHGLPAG
jgi:hypothetical protein